MVNRNNYTEKRNYSLLRASSYSPSCIRFNPIISASRNVTGGGSFCSFRGVFVDGGEIRATGGVDMTLYVVPYESAEEAN